MVLAAVAGMILSIGASDLPAVEVQAWTFDADAQGWIANGHLGNVGVKEGVLSADAADWDPFFTCSGLDIQTRAWQYVVLRMRASEPGKGQLFWTADTEGQHGGFSQEKNTPFGVTGNGAWEDIAIFPFWQAEGTIRQLRLDVYNGAHFDIDSIRIFDWGQDTPPDADTFSWEFKGDTKAWQVHPQAHELFSPPLNLAVTDKGWANVVLKSDKDGTGSFLWSVADSYGLRSADFAVRGGAEPRTYNVELQGLPGWHDGVVALGIRLPRPGKGVRLDTIAVADEPAGPAELVVTYLGFENAPNRTTKPCRVIANVVNDGGSMSQPLYARLVVSPELRFRSSDGAQRIPALDWGETHTVGWEVSTVLPGNHEVMLKVGDGPMQRTRLHFTKALQVPRGDYVPEPRPIQMAYELCAFYFPGWDSDAKWDCIRRVAPNRKPMLGYYDESNPECVDWQIKWAVDSGISCFLVDWYWCEGRQSLRHWFDAYRKARYRDFLKVAIMWANHNPANTHSLEDWRNVTQEWIDNYFTLPGYYHMNGKPAVYIWAPGNIRRDLGGSDAAKAALDASQEMAQKAGHAGITFVAMGYDFSKSGIQALAHEGYVGITTYHEWGDRSGGQKRMHFKKVADASPEAWAKKDEASGPLTYHPLIDTGWDSRPWHGDKAFAIEGRTPDLFVRLLEHAAAFAKEHEKKTLILGPLNEWGEGSYIEPCTEFGFEMMAAIRDVLGRGDPRSWGQYVSPRDLGLGPYDYPPQPPVGTWDFNREPCGWQAMMGVSGLGCSEGHLRFETATSDPALLAKTYGIRAKGYTKAVIAMQLSGAIPEGGQGQLFWSVNGAAMTEATSTHFALETDGQPHKYVLDLTANPRWRSRIATLRFDPCSQKGVQVAIDSIHLLE